MRQQSTARLSRHVGRRRRGGRVPWTGPPAVNSAVEPAGRTKRDVRTPVHADASGCSSHRLRQSILMGIGIGASIAIASAASLIVALALGHQFGWYSLPWGVLRDSLSWNLLLTVEASIASVVAIISGTYICRSSGAKRATTG